MDIEILHVVVLDIKPYMSIVFSYMVLYLFMSIT